MYYTTLIYKKQSLLENFPDIFKQKALLKIDVDFSYRNPNEGLISLGTLLICLSSTIFTIALIINNKFNKAKQKKKTAANCLPLDYDALFLL